MDERVQHNSLVGHPLQRYEWGEFRQSLGEKVVRFQWNDARGRLRATQLTLQRIQATGLSIGYSPKGFPPEPLQLKRLRELGRQENCLSIKLEPFEAPKIHFQELSPSRSLFSPTCRILDLTPSQDEMLDRMHPKTRYNTRLGSRQGVTVRRRKSSTEFAHFLRLLSETSERQGFAVAPEPYYWRFWEVFGASDCLEIFSATYRGEVLAAALVFLHQSKLYYPHAASTRKYRGVMASHVLLWEILRFGKAEGYQTLDFWGTPDPRSRGGLDRFLESFGAASTSCPGAFDLLMGAAL
jgi:peptidoglycan pentaglycine glycine transferase (the first glycine)